MAGFLERVFGRSGQSKNDGPDQSPEEKKRMEGLIDRVMRASPTGKKVIEEAMDRGVTFQFNKEIGGNCIGVYNRRKNTVTVSPLFKDAALLSVLVHEARHSAQTVLPDYRSDMKSCILVNRSNEADAMATESVAICEMKEAEPQAFELFQMCHPEPLSPCLKEFEKSGDVSKSMFAAFKGWFGDKPYVTEYDKTNVDILCKASKISGAYKKELSGEEIANNIPGINGKSYIDPSFFSTKQALFIREDEAVVAAAAERKRKSTLFHKLQATSMDKMFIIKKEDMLTRSMDLPAEMPEKAAVGVSIVKNAAARHART